MNTKVIFWNSCLLPPNKQSVKNQDVQFNNRSVPPSQWNIDQPCLNCGCFNALLSNLNNIGDFWNN